MDGLRLYLDECVHAKAAQAFRDAGIDAIGVHDIESLQLYDSQQLELAAAEDRMIVTYNVKDFVPLHTQWLEEEKVHAGILLSPIDYKKGVGALVRDVRATLLEERNRRGADGYDWVRGELLWIHRYGA
ncbi:MAG TPA: DUF5615 family PIN-like protein [Longimicrobium sp.]